MKRRSLSFRGHLWAIGKAEDELHGKEINDEGREWFAITAFPLFAGTFGTIASALNICALVKPWKCEVKSIGTLDVIIDVKDIPDPTWLVVANSISLVFGIIANITILLLRGDSSFPLSKYLLQLVLATITCGFMASFILIALVVAAFYELRYTSPPEHAFTEAYFYAIEASVIYFLTSAFVIYTAYMLWHSHRTRNDLAKQFAGEHLSLKILTIVFMAYILIGALIFSRIENWRYLDGVFWADVTILTVGFGDFKPQTHLGRCLLFPYAVFGVFFLFLILYCITQVVFERGSSLWEARIRDQQRQRAVEHRRKKGHIGVKRSTHETQPPVPSFFLSRADGNHNTTPGASQSPPNDRSEQERLSKRHRKREARERRREDFEKMQDIALKATSHRIFLSIGIWLAFSVFLWIGGAVLFYLSERDQGWTYFNAIYFTFISLLTIGYGDNNLISTSGKAIFVLWSLIVIPSLTMLISSGTQLVGMPYLTQTKSWVRRRLARSEKEEKGELKMRLSSTMNPSSLPHNNHDKNHLIVQAIKSIARDHIQNQTNNTQSTYSFDDWEYIFYLMGILDSGEEEPAARSPQAHTTDRGAEPTSSATERRSQQAGEPVRRQTGMGAWQGDGEVLDWLHGKNPLNVSETLTEWMLLTLVEKLEDELADLRRSMGNTPIAGEGGSEEVVVNGS